MNRFAFALVLTLVACGDGAGPSPEPDRAWVADVRTRAHALASIDVDAADDSDLAFLHDVLAGRRIAELGENTHGAAQYSRAKTRLVKYLHEQLGFDVLVWESSILATYLVDLDLDTRSAQQATLDALPAIDDIHAVPRQQMDGVLYFESIDPPVFIDP